MQSSMKDEGYKIMRVNSTQGEMHPGGAKILVFSHLENMRGLSAMTASSRWSPLTHRVNTVAYLFPCACGCANTGVLWSIPQRAGRAPLPPSPSQCSAQHSLAPWEHQQRCAWMPAHQQHRELHTNTCFSRETDKLSLGEHSF